MFDARRGWLALFGVALGLRLALFVAIEVRHPAGLFDVDSRGYWSLAGNLLEHGVFSLDEAPPLRPDASRTPGYPVFLAALRALGAGPGAAVLLQVLLGALGCVLAAQLAQRLTARRDAAILAGLLVALDVPSISAASSLLSETLFTVLLLASALPLQGAMDGRASAGRGRALAAASGAVLGLAVLCRPIGIVLAFVWAGTLAAALRDRPARALVAVVTLVCACATVVAPWIARNQRALGAPLLSTIATTNLYEYKAAAVLAEAEGAPLPQVQQRLRADARARFPGEPAADPAGFARTQAPLAAEILWAHPWITLRTQLATAVGLLVRPLRSSLDLQLGLRARGNTVAEWGSASGESLPERLWRRTSGVTLVLVLLQLPLLLALWTGAVVGLGRLWREGRLETVLFITGLAAALTLASAGAEAYARFRVPMVPFVAAPAGLGLALWLERRAPRLLAAGGRRAALVR